MPLDEKMKLLILSDLYLEHANYEFDTIIVEI